MQYIDESGPWTADHFRKYATYLKLRKERDKFLKSLREVRYCDWLIDKKLVEAGGLGKTVYILPARGGGTSFRTLKKINDFIEEGRDVEVVTLRKHDYPKLSRKDIETIRESIQQFELYSQMVKPWRDPHLHGLFNDFELPGTKLSVLDQSIFNRTYLGKWVYNMDERVCEECTRRCAQFGCCLCEHRHICRCAKIEPPDEEE